MPDEHNDIQIPVYEHALPYEVLWDELEAQGRAQPEDWQLVRAARSAYAAYDKVKNELDDWSARHPGNHEKDTPEGQELAQRIEAVRAAERTCKACDQKFTTVLHREGRSALCFSGGGIRSASVCLGILQSLARFSARCPDHQGMLHKTSFLSTVSGGGYIGSWLMAWAKRHPHGYHGAIAELAQTPQIGRTSVDPEPRTIRHLREFTSFLAPRLGGLTVDTWTLAATVLRNLFLNNCMLLPVFAAVLCVPILVGSLMSHLASRPHCWTEHEWLVAFSATLFVSLALLVIVQLISTRWQEAFDVEFLNARALMFLSNLLVSLVVAGLVVFWLISPNHEFGWISIESFAVYIAFPLTVPAIYGALLAVKAGAGPEKYWRFAAAVPLVALATSTLLLLLVQGAGWLKLQFQELPHFAQHWSGAELWPENNSVYVLGVPLVWGILLTASSLFTGIVADADTEENREWWARMKAVHMLLMFGWLAAAVIAYYGPILVNWIFALVTAAVGSMAASIAKSPKTPALPGKGSGSNLDVIGELLGLLFIFLLAITLAFVNRWAMGDFNNGKCWLAYALILGGFAFFCNFFFSVNVFSLQGMYRSRLIRAYLGASNESRTPDFFTNFDPDDNLRMKNLPHDSTAPLHIVNTTLNMVATTNTAWSQRKAESFTISPLHCGSLRAGYVRTRCYAGHEGLTLGTAMAISGAAVNPNMGYHSSPLLTLIMTLFNVRLGSWLPNPRKIKDAGFFRRASPALALGPLLHEALGQTDDKGRYVQLSDGAHFENLALYEMVMRRCHRIVVVDAGADPDFQFEDLANAVRKIRIDLGIPIEFIADNHIPTGNNPQAAYCAIATIHYAAIDYHNRDDNTKDGQLIYFKPAVRGSEPIDIQNYAATHKTFPHETTADQFFNEAQFESYRQLGMTMADAVISRAAPADCTTDHFFMAAWQYCAPMPTIPASTQEIISRVSTFLKSGHMKVTTATS
ncbi:MAG TPA: hypothetical protein VND65_21135 [Candidatus Binatia bacterium]|nr:hypothetical protein [Candidatus Binatia bacterium]